MRHDATGYRPLTTEEQQALHDFAEAHGRYWKHDLHDAWMHATLTGPLHALRNSHGPRWLYRLPSHATHAPIRAQVSQTYTPLPCRNTLDATLAQAQAPRFAVMGCGADGLLIDTQAPDTLEQPALLACLPYDDAQHYARALNQGAARMAADLDRAARLAGVLADAMVRSSRQA